MSFCSKRFQSILVEKLEAAVQTAQLSGYRVEENRLIGGVVVTALSADGAKQLQYARTSGVVKTIIEKLESAPK